MTAFSHTSDKGNYKIFTYTLSSPFFKMEKIMQVSYILM